MQSIRHRHPDVFAIADKFVRLTQDFPWGRSLTHSADPVENLWRYYNIVFVVASHRLLRASIAVMEAGLVLEALLPIRTHLELLGVQRYVESDKSRVVTFAVRGAKRQQQLVERARRLGHGDPTDWSAMAGKASRDLKRLRKHDADAPFARSAKEILKEVGFEQDVEGVLRVADNWVHMNAAALDHYAYATDEGQVVVELGPDTEGANLLLNSVRYHYGILDVANEALDLGQQRALSAEEFGPRGTRVPRSRAKAFAAQDVADRHRGYIVAELEELATDALVAPAGVVVCEPDDQLFHLGWEGRPTPALAPPSRRSPCDEITVPPEQCLGPDGE